MFSQRSDPRPPVPTHRSIQAGPNARLPPTSMIIDPRMSTATANPRMSTLKPAPPRHQTFYAIVQYDFSAERPDELDAKAGEPISVVAQSNREWFVAKPIGRLGGPGLIPVSFVEIRDPLTNLPVKDVDALMEKGVLPRVEEWKQATAEYKASSIPLGVIDDAGEGVKDSPFAKATPGGHPVPPQQYNARGPQGDHAQSQAPNTSRILSSHTEGEPRSSSDPATASTADLLPPGNILSATIPSFHFENSEYWFRIDATWQTADQQHTYQLVLYRNYDDFYDFQIQLLDEFPVEAGRKPPPQTDQHGYPTPPPSEESEQGNRILPYMPGPVTFVDDMITSVRRSELDQYLAELCALQVQGAGHVLQHDLVRTFFSAKSGDVIEEIENVIPEPVEAQQNEEEYTYGNEEEDEVAERMGQMHLRQQSSYSQQQPSRASGASYDGYRSQSSRAGYDRTSRADEAGGRFSGTDYGRSTPQKSRTSSPNKNGVFVTQAPDSRPGSQAGGSSFYEPGHGHSYSYSSMTGSMTGSSTLSPPVGGNHPYGQSGSGGSAASGSRSARSSGGADVMQGSPNPNGESSPAFLKIKIFHSESDDLIAIRVPPRVTYNQLISKVRDRLGDGVSMLRYRDSLDGSSKTWREIGGDDDLKSWIGKGDKLVLYAD